MRNKAFLRALWRFIWTPLLLGPNVSFAQATFEPATGRVVIPTVDVSGRTYRDVVLQLGSDGKFTISSVTAPMQSLSAYESCTPPSVASLQVGNSGATFQDFGQLTKALEGDWQGCDTTGKIIKHTYAATKQSGTISKVVTYYATWTYCDYTLNRIGGSERLGYQMFWFSSVNCSEGDAKEARSKMVHIRAIGSPGFISEIVLEVDFVPIARMRRL